MVVAITATFFVVYLGRKYRACHGAGQAICCPSSYGNNGLLLATHRGVMAQQDALCGACFEELELQVDKWHYLARPYLQYTVDKEGKDDSLDNKRCLLQHTL